MSLLAATKTPATPQAVAEALCRVWKIEFGGGYPILPQLCVLLAQFCLETANGTSMVQWNVGNAKSNGTIGDWCFFTTWEDGIPAAQARAMVAADPRCTPDRRPGKPDWDDPTSKALSVFFHPDHPASRFVAFASLDDGVQHYLHGMFARWTKAWPYSCEGDPEGFAYGLKEQGYYTATLASYAADMRARFDHLMATIRMPDDPMADTLPGV